MRYKHNVKCHLKIHSMVFTLFCTFVLLCMLGGCGVAYHSSTKWHADMVVTEKERIAEQRGGKYLVFAEDSDGNITVFRCTDTVWFWRWNASDTYGSIRVGETYRFKTAGWRIPFFSMYQNILEIEPVE